MRSLAESRPRSRRDETRDDLHVSLDLGTLRAGFHGHAFRGGFSHLVELADAATSAASSPAFSTPLRTLTERRLSSFTSFHPRRSHRRFLLHFTLDGSRLRRPSSFGCRGLEQFLIFAQQRKRRAWGSSPRDPPAASSAMYATCRPSSTLGTITIMDGQQRPETRFHHDLSADVRHHR